MQHAAMTSSLKLGYGQASVVVMSQKILFETARALPMKMTVQVMKAVMTTMKTNNVHALAELQITQSGHRGEMLNYKRFKITFIVSKQNWHLAQLFAKTVRTRKNSLNVPKK